MPSKVEEPASHDNRGDRCHLDGWLDGYMNASTWLVQRLTWWLVTARLTARRGPLNCSLDGSTWLTGSSATRMASCSRRASSLSASPETPACSLPAGTWSQGRRGHHDCMPSLHCIAVPTMYSFYLFVVGLHDSVDHISLINEPWFLSLSVTKSSCMHPCSVTPLPANWIFSNVKGDDHHHATLLNDARREKLSRRLGQ